MARTPWSLRWCVAIALLATTARGAEKGADCEALKRQVAEAHQRFLDAPADRSSDAIQAEMGAQSRYEACVKAEADPETVKEDAKAMRIVFGAIFCMWNEKRSAVLAEIKEQRKYARIGGVINKRELYALQLQLRNTDEAIAEQKENLRDYKGVKPAPCSQSDVKRLINCYEDRKTCATPRQRAMSAFLPDVDFQDRMDSITGKVPGSRRVADDPDRFMMAPSR